ncbi:MAG TPA: sulfatase-like hydrolase/transferase [Solirubrobacteraceae bacterium]|nr:sulfatase-like hydrolase/transferase [Solirubrobacteraceae bacterium]
MGSTARHWGHPGRAHSWSRRSRLTGWALLSGIALAFMIAAVAGAFSAGSPAPAGRPASVPAARSGSSASGAALAPAQTTSRRPRHPNVVFVLTDDLSMNLLRYMPQVQALQARGLTFRNYFVSDSLCCPSRTSIFTGNFPHDTGVYDNVGRMGGIRAFYDHGNEYNTFNLALQKAGYRTAMMGKYLNGYLQGPKRSPVSNRYVPPGWSRWDVAGFAYSEFHYRLNQNGRIRRYGDAPGDYLTDVLARHGTSFINSSAAQHKPFFLEIGTFAPHQPYTPAPQDANKFPGLVAPRSPAFDVLPNNPPRWLSGHHPLTQSQINTINADFRKRVQDVQDVDRLLTRLEAALSRHHELKNTYIVFSSDNGYHMGEYRLTPGKLTAFDTDIHVPLVIAGPGIPAGSTTGALAENTDLAKTFEGMAGTFKPCDGHSLLPLFHGGIPKHWRNAVLVEHHGPATSAQDPDQQNAASGNPTSYEAMRTPGFLYVEYQDGEREFYDLRHDPYELHDLAGQLSATQVGRLHGELLRLENCHTGRACWSAEHVSGTP